MKLPTTVTTEAEGGRRYTSSRPAKADEEEPSTSPASQPASGSSSPMSRAESSSDARYLGPSKDGRSLSETLRQHTGQTLPQHPNYTNWRKANRRNGSDPVLNAKQDAHPKDLKSSLRSLLRQVAQPVAVVTSYMPQQDLETPLDPRSTGSHELGEEPHRFHGATLSSFSSIAMDPHPLVAFALRVPSRMATTLSTMVPTILNPSSVPPTQSSSVAANDNPTHLVLNILSSSQHGLAHAFSRPDVHSHPFKLAQHTLSADGLPILDKALGAFSCKVVARVKLSELGRSEEAESGLGGGVASELFIAQVVRVEEVADTGKMPLLYWRRGYTKVTGRVAGQPGP